MIESLVQLTVDYLHGLPPSGVLAVLFLFAFVENLFPPSPSDVIVVFCGSLVGVGVIGFFPGVVSATLGGVAGFMVMYYIGSSAGRKVLSTRLGRYLPEDSIEKVEGWFGKYGYWLIVANRFLSGTRAVIAFFAGVAKLDLLKTTLLSLASSLLWNSVLIYGGMKLGEHWKDIGEFLESYSRIITPMVIVALAWVLFRYFYLNKKKKTIDEV